MPKRARIHQAAPARDKVWQPQPASYGQGRGGRPWRRIRDAVMKRDQHLCQACRRDGRLTLATQVDHILAKARGGTDDQANLEAICGPHHEIKTRAEARHGRGL